MCKKNEEWLRITQIMEETGNNTVSAFAKEIGLNRAENLYQIKRGNNGISKELCNIINAKYPQYARGYIMFGHEHIDLSHAINFSDIPVNLAYMFGVKNDMIEQFMGDYLSPLIPSGSFIVYNEININSDLNYGLPYCVETETMRYYRIVHPSADKRCILLEATIPDKYRPFEISKDSIIRIREIVGVLKMFSMKG